MIEFSFSDELYSGKGVSVVCLLCLVRGIFYMVFVFLIGDMFSDMKFILREFFR